MQNAPVYDVDIFAPHQEHSNRSDSEKHSSACGPFIWEMSREIAQYVIDCREETSLPDTYYINIFYPVAFRVRKD